MISDGAIYIIFVLYYIILLYCYNIIYVYQLGEAKELHMELVRLDAAKRKRRDKFGR